MEDYGEPIWKHIVYSKRSLKHYYGFLLIQLIGIIVGYLIFFIFMDTEFYLQIIIVIMFIAFFYVTTQRVVKFELLGHSFYPNGILLFTKSPLKIYDRFVNYSEISNIRIGLSPKKLEDLAFAKRLMAKYKEKWNHTIEEYVLTYEDCIFIETASQDIHYISAASSLELPRFLKIQDDKNVAYVLHPEIEEYLKQN